MSILRASTPPPPWQRSLGERLSAALKRSLAAYPAAEDSAAPAPRWPVPRAAEAHAAQALAGPDGTLAQLFAQCLRLYREQLQRTPDDDVLRALACFLCACAQALEGHAVTPERWQRTADWLGLWLLPDEAEATAPIEERQQSFERLATLAVAVGEWSVQASRQGETAMASARLMAAEHLRHELDLDAGLLLRALRWQGLISADRNTPSWDDAELPKAPTVRNEDLRL